MKKLALIFCIIFSLSCFHNTNSQVLENGYYMGKEKYNILQTFYYLIAIDDTIARLEFYMVSKGQTSSYYFFKNEDKLPIAEHFKISRDGCNYILENNVNKSLDIKVKDEVILTGGGHMVVLKKVEHVSKCCVSMKNESLYTFAYYHPHLIMGYDKKFEPKKEIRICSDLRNSNLIEQSGQLNHSEFEKLLHKELKKIIMKE